MKNDAVAVEFIALIDIAVERAQALQNDLMTRGDKPGSVKAAELTIKNLQKLKNNVVEETLPKPSLGDVSSNAGLGMIRGVGEWCEDDKLLSCVEDIEHFFQERW
jgi:hypothetical protein